MMQAWAIDSHPGDSRIRIAGDISPTLTYKLAKVSADGPLVLIKNGDPNDSSTPPLRHQIVENHGHDSRVGFVPGNIVPTLNTRMGTGGNNVPLVLEILR